MRIDIVLESHPRISMGLLRRHGMFVSDVSELAFKIGEAVVFVRYYPEDNALRLTWKSSSYDQQQLIGLGFTKLKFGDRRYFICPLTGKRTSELHLVGGNFGCRQAHARLSAKNGSPTQRFELRISRWRAQLLGEQGYVRVRGKTRNRIIQKLKPIPFILGRFPELAPVFHDESARPVREARCRARSSRRADAMSMASAMSAGRSLTTSDVLNAHANLAAEIWLASIPKPSGHPLVATRAELESHAALDVRALAAIGLGKVVLAAHGLVWRLPDGTEIARALLVVDFRVADRPFLAVRSITGVDGAIPAQFVRLVPSATAGRWFLECPLLGTRCDILFLRGRRFASAKANRLVHRSQRKAAT